MAWDVPFSVETAHRIQYSVIICLKKKQCHKFEFLLSGKVCADDELCEEGPRGGEAWDANCTDLTFVNPIISITPSKPSVSSGSLFTLLNCKICYLSHVNYDPPAADLISIRVTIYLRPGGGGGRRGNTLEWFKTPVWPLTTS
jgi:hypothetical protein